MRLTPPRGYEVFSLMTWSMGDAHRYTRARHGCEERGATARVTVRGASPLGSRARTATLATRPQPCPVGGRAWAFRLWGALVHLNKVFLRCGAAACRLTRPRELRAASTAPPLQLGHTRTQTLSVTQAMILSLAPGRGVRVLNDASAFGSRRFRLAVAATAVSGGSCTSRLVLSFLRRKRILGRCGLLMAHRVRQRRIALLCERSRQHGTPRDVTHR